MNYKTSSRARKLNASTTKKLVCLACDKPFLSQGPWNHICQPCAKKNEHKFHRQPYKVIDDSLKDILHSIGL